VAYRLPVPNTSLAEIDSLKTGDKLIARAARGRWFFVGMASVMIATTIAGFLPAIISPATRHAPLSPLAAVHGIVFFAFQLLYLAQSLLVATRHVAWHRRLGVTSVVLLALIIPLSFATTTAMVRRGFDLSGDQRIVPHPAAGSIYLDAPASSLFNFAVLFTFSVLAIAAILYRRRPEIHKRLMLFANLALMRTAIAHLVGHIPQTGDTGVTIWLSYTLFLLTAVARDYLVEKRVRAMTAVIAIGMWVSPPIEGLVIAPSATWHRFAEWISQ